MTAHALLSASASKRWLTCTPSARLEATLPEPKKAPGSFDFSQEGVDFSITPYKLGRSLFNKVSGLLGQYMDVEGIAQ